MEVYMKVKDLLDSELSELALHIYQEDNTMYADVLEQEDYSITVVYLPKIEQCVYIFTSKDFTRVERRSITLDAMRGLLDNRALIEEEVYTLFEEEIRVCTRSGDKDYVPF